MRQFESLHYETHGDKNHPAVLFLHGFMGNGGSWNEIIDTLQKNFFCITIDLPGHGQSLNVDESHYKMPECAKIIIKIIDKLKIDKFSLVGYSMGGRLGFFIALNYPEYIKRAVLESASPGLKTEREKIERQHSDGLLALELERSPLADFVGKWYAQPLFKPLRKNKKRFQELLQKRLVNAPRGLAGSLRFTGLGAQPSLWENLKEIKCPTLLIVGELDTKFQEIANKMSAESTKMKIRSMNDAGHNVHFEQPAEYAKTLKKFLR